MDIGNRAVIPSGQGVPTGSKVRAVEWAHAPKTFSTPDAPPLLPWNPASNRCDPSVRSLSSTNQHDGAMVPLGRPLGNRLITDARIASCRSEPAPAKIRHAEFSPQRPRVPAPLPLRCSSVLPATPSSDLLVRRPGGVQHTALSRVCDRVRCTEPPALDDRS